MSGRRAEIERQADTDARRAAYAHERAAAARAGLYWSLIDTSAEYRPEYVEITSDSRYRDTLRLLGPLAPEVAAGYAATLVHLGDQWMILYRAGDRDGRDAVNAARREVAEAAVQAYGAALRFLATHYPEVRVW